MWAAAHDGGTVTSPCVLIVDSVSAVISPILGNPQHSAGFVLMSAVGRALKALATHHHLAVLITNHVTAARGNRSEVGGAAERQGAARGSGQRGNWVAALGDAWRAQPHVRVLLTFSDDGPEGLRVATLTHSNSVVSCSFGHGGWLGGGGASCVAVYQCLNRSRHVLCITHAQMIGGQASFRIGDSQLASVGLHGGGTTGV